MPGIKLNRLSRSNFARPGSPDPGQKRGFGNPLRAILDLLRLPKSRRTSEVFPPATDSWAVTTPTSFDLLNSISGSSPSWHDLYTAPKTAQLSIRRRQLVAGRHREQVLASMIAGVSAVQLRSFRTVIKAHAGIPVHQLMRGGPAKALPCSFSYDDMAR